MPFLPLRAGFGGIIRGIGVSPPGLLIRSGFFRLGVERSENGGLGSFITRTEFLTTACFGQLRHFQHYFIQIVMVVICEPL